MAAYRLGIAGEATRQFGSVAGHHATPRSALALCCVEAVNRLWDSAKSRGRNITLGATYSALCSTAHKTDAATGEHGDLLDLIAMNRGLDRLRDVEAEVRQFLTLPPPDPIPFRAASRNSSEAARRLFAIGRPITGTLADAYLRSRRIVPEGDLGWLRFHPAVWYRADHDTPGQRWPALLAAVTDLEGRITGVHRTWLDGRTAGLAPLVDPRRAMGCLLGHGVHFGRPVDVLVAGEGIETVLSLRRLLPAMPMIAALSAWHLAALILPPGLQRLYIARDEDAAGRAAAMRLRQRATDAGVARILDLVPRVGDFNDDLRAEGPAALLARVGSQLHPFDIARFVSKPAGMVSWAWRPWSGPGELGCRHEDHRDR
jgi:hypothetical protein